MFAILKMLKKNQDRSEMVGGAFIARGSIGLNRTLPILNLCFPVLYNSAKIWENSTANLIWRKKSLEKIGQILQLIYTVY